MILTILGAVLAYTSHNTYSAPEIEADEAQMSVTGVIPEEPSSAVHSLVC